ncbi:MAG: fatty acid desaturase [Ignavibacteriaceae bacterium]|nr:fatty acid desaturase [Ignavibacteriaceae bacterium]
MAQDKFQFQFSDQPEPHRARTKEIIKNHPEIRNLIDRTPASFLLILLVVGAQITISYLLKDQSWWLVLLTAYLVGAFANHSLFVLIHEAAHNLIFRQRTMNILSGIIADIPNVLPSSVSFRSYHLKHHSFQGNYYLDADLASKWEARLIGDTFLGKALWEIFFPVFQALRTLRLKEIKFANTWTFINWIVVFGVDALVIIFFGPMSFLYLVLSFFLSIGFHPLGARWIQEHFLVKPPQETYSYYGPLNILALNVGYHNEHHDFPSVPWNNLRKVKRAAPEYYDNLYYHTSWFKLWLKFLFSPELSLYSRMLRDNRGELPVKQEF